MQGIFKFIAKNCVILLFITFLSLSAYSQKLSTQDIQQVQQLAPGIDPTQMTKTGFESYFRDNNQSKAGSDRTKENAATARQLQNKTLIKDSTQNDNIKKGYYNINDTYGNNVFQNSSIYDISELSTPPLDYPIGVGDHIVVALWGGGEYQEDYIVARDGAIFPNSLGKITVQGLTFEMARSLIYARFKSVVPSGTNIQITLGQPRTISVNVGGEVENPGPVTVSAFSNAYNVIGLAGGITDFGNLREIQVKRNGKVIETIDIYKYLSTGEMGSRIYLQNNDFVFVNNEVKKVFATGQFKRPMYYQLKKDEGIKALITFSGGFTPEAFTSGIKVIRSENEDQVIHDVNATAIIKLQGLDYPLLDGDIIKADLIKTGLVNKLELKGPVKYPGFYELRKSDRLFDVINRAGGITKNTYLARAYIFRGAGDSTNIKSDKLEVDLTDIQSDNANSSNNVLLMPNDIVQLFSNNEFGDQQYVEIFGEVRKEGRVRKYGGMTLQDLLYLSGGIKQSAEYGRLEISSIVDIDSAKQGLKPTRTIVKSYSIKPDFASDSVAATIILKPFDQIFVRKNSSFDLQQNVQILGLVKYAGLYPRLDRYERLSSYIQRAGGTMPNANLAGAVLFRKKVDFFREKIVSKPKLDSLGNIIKDSSVLNLDVPVSIDLYNALKYPSTDHDIILQENDIVYVPEINPFITVQGSVQSPLKITFDPEHTNLSYYLDKAGGFGVKPWKKRIFVSYANGSSKRTSNFLVFHFYPKVKEGSTITVPAKPPNQELNNALTLAITIALPIVLTYAIAAIIRAN